MRIAALGLVLLLGVAVSMSGQTLGEITGEVRDPSGSVVVGAEMLVYQQRHGRCPARCYQRSWPI